jgi:hypothetical protein
MDQIQKDNLDMFKRVKKYVTDTDTISTTRPALVTAAGKLQTEVIDKIIEKAGLQEQQSGGETTGKTAKREVLNTKLFTMTSGTFGFADLKGKDTLKGQMNYSMSDIAAITDDQIVPTANNLVALADPFKDDPDLNDFGVDATTLTAVEDARDGYMEVESDPQAISDIKEAATEALVPLFDKGKSILRNQMDKAADTLKETQGDWWNAYHNARAIISTGHRSTSADGFAYIKDTTTGIYKVKVKAEHEDGTITEVLTDETGYYKFNYLKFGIYIFTYTHADYTDIVLAAFRIKKGQRVTKNVFMELK